MHTVCIIQARMGSSRLPGKVMKPMAGKPALWHVLDRVGRCRLINDIVIATTTDPADQQIVDYCYTGHTGQVAATALALLGYDVTNMKFGIMGWTDDAEVLAQPGFSGTAGYPVETEANEL